MKAKPARFEPIALATNDPEKGLAVSELDLVGDCLQARVHVRSHGFAAEKNLQIDDFRSVVASLREMSSKLKGETKLGAAYEDDQIVMSMNDRGQLLVGGRLVMYGEHTHRLEFEFRTDQTALPPFVHELEAFLREAR